MNKFQIYRNGIIFILLHKFIITKMQVKNITECIEQIAPISLQESYDNAGLIIGSSDSEVDRLLLCIDVTEDVLNEAIEKNCQMIISHHPLIFKGLKKINGKNSIENIIINSIKNNIAIYAAHTNLDNIITGVNSIFAQKLGLKNLQILQPKRELLYKLVTYCPVEHADNVRNAICDAGAGYIGNYDNCSFNIEGTGTFRALENANPFVGKTKELHHENEIRIETIFPYYIEKEVINALKKAHPYEEIAFDIYKLNNELNTIGSGLIGEIEPLDEMVFLKNLKSTFNAKSIRHTKILDKPIRRVAICGGSGSFLIHDAIAAKADIFITGDIKYHDFFEAEGKIIITDIGHFESEQFTKELLYTIITKKFPNFAVLISERNTNPIHYL